MNKYEITKSVLFGAATGDAFGVPVEFMSRKEVRAANIRDMEGCDTHSGEYGVFSDKIPAGAWSDDTSMAVAAMESICMNHGNICYDDIMQQFIRWWYTGAYSSLLFPFGLGRTCSRALDNYKSGIPAINCGPTGEYDNGNGALMRIFPFSLYCILNGLGIDTTVEIINAASGLTHGHSISKMGCLIFTNFMRELLRCETVQEAWSAARSFDYGKYYDEHTCEAYALLLDDVFPNIDDSVIGESGYVVDTIMAAVHSMLIGHNYESSILCAVNLGYDTDTNAAVTGALAGAFYGIRSIPNRWLVVLRKRLELKSIALRFAGVLT